MIKAYLKLIRVHQWTKNGLCFVGLLFSPLIRHLESWRLAFLAFFAFSLCSSAVYVFNDIIDRKRDRQHAKKRKRPLASGQIEVKTAFFLMLMLMTSALVSAWFLHWTVFLCLCFYLFNNLIYTFFLKHMFLFDVMAIAVGFVLRLCAGTYLIGETPTAWVVLCTFFLAVFLGFAKRYAELMGLSRQGNLNESDVRPVLLTYSEDYLKQLLDNAATMAIICYALFTVTSNKNPTLVLTLPIVYYAIMYYKRKVVLERSGEEPDKILLTDPKIGLCILLWLVTFMTIEWYDLRLLN
jgi:4-hydroxybenzoate polyprenyltransferase